LLADISFQVEHRVEPVDQLAIRFHHRLVSIHPFPHGNGRHARLIAAALIEQLGTSLFPGRQQLVGGGLNPAAALHHLSAASRPGRQQRFAGFRACW
jgi:hypothetical protein